MKKIIGNLLYDTEKAEKIYSYRLRRKTGSIGNYNTYHWFDVDVYKTKNGNYFLHGYSRDGYYKPFIQEFSESEFKEVLKEIDPDKYIKFEFEVIEEA